MIIKTINNRTFLFVGVPEVSEGILTRYAFSGWYYVLKSNDLNAEKFFIGKSKYLFVLIGLASDLTEDEWKGIVESKIEKGASFNTILGHYQSDGWTTFYRNYLYTSPSICIPNTATNSGHSLLLSLSLKPHTTLIIEKK